MASKMSFGVDNHTTTATYSLLSGTENVQYPLTNINKVFTTKTFRSNENTCVIQIDMQSNQSIDTFMVAGNNITGLGFNTATIEFSPTTIFPGTSIETVDLSAGHNFGFVQFTSGAYRYAKLTLTGIDYCELANIYIGARTEIENNNFDTTSFKYSISDNHKAKSNNYGQLFIDKYNKTNSISGTIKYANLTEFEQLNNMYTAVGNTIPMWFMLDNEGCMSTDGTSKYLFSGYFYIVGSLEWSASASLLFDTTITMVEVV
jgi:hypothetical protein